MIIAVTITDLTVLVRSTSDQLLPHILAMTITVGQVTLGLMVMNFVHFTLKIHCGTETSPSENNCCNRPGMPWFFRQLPVKECSKYRSEDL